MAKAANGNNRSRGRVSAALRRRDAQLNVRLLIVMGHLVTIATLIGSSFYFMHVDRPLVLAIFGSVYALFLASLIVAVRDWKRHGIKDSPTVRRCAIVSAFSGIALAPFTPGGVAMQFQTLTLSSLMPRGKRITLGGAAIAASVLICAYAYRITGLDWLTGIQITSGFIALSVMFGRLAAENLHEAAKPDPFASSLVDLNDVRAARREQAG